MHEIEVPIPVAVASDIDNDTGGLILYAQRRCPDTGALDPYGRQFVPFGTLLVDDDGTIVELVDRKSPSDPATTTCRVRLKLSQHARRRRGRHRSGDFDKLVAGWTRAHDAINTRVIEFFTGTDYDNVRARRDICLLEANSVPIQNASVIAFMRTRFARGVMHDDRFFMQCLQVELDARSRTVDWFVSEARKRTLDALDVAMSSLTVVARTMRYVADRGDSYDPGLVNLCGDCEDINNVICVIAHVLTTDLKARVHGTAVRALCELLSFYDFLAMFGGVASAAANEGGGGDSAGEFGNHFWAVSMRRGSSSQSTLPRLWMLEGTGFIAPSVIPLGMHAPAKSAERHTLLVRQFYDTLYRKSVDDALGDRKHPDVLLGPVFAYDLTMDADQQMQPFFYREPVGMIDARGIYAVCDLRGAYGAPLLHLLRGKANVIPVVHVKEGSEEDIALDADAAMRTPNPALRTPTAESISPPPLILPTRMCDDSGVPTPHPAQARCICFMRYELAQGFIDTLAASDVHWDALLVRHYPLYESAAGERLDLVQIVLGRDISADMKRTMHEWDRFEHVHHLWEE